PVQQAGPVHRQPLPGAERPVLVANPALLLISRPGRSSGPHITLGHDSQVRPGSQRLGKAARKHLIVHPKSKAPARYAAHAWLPTNLPPDSTIDHNSSPAICATPFF